MPNAPEQVRGVAGRATSNRGIHSDQGNPGTLLGAEMIDGVPHARYQARQGTWVSASMREIGYDRWFGRDTAYGAYAGYVRAADGSVLASPDRITVGQEYLIPIPTARKAANVAPAQAASSNPHATGASARGTVATTTGPSDRPAWWPTLRAGTISFELEEAWKLKPPEDIQTELILPQTQVLAWLRKYRYSIVNAERRWRVDRRAIAAAIAWEALENARTVSVRAVGPAKVHVNAEVVNEVEEAGYLPRRSESERRRLLKDPETAIQYIGAIMSAKAAVAEAFGFEIRARVDILANEFQGRSLKDWAAHLANKKNTNLEAANSMGLWAAQPENLTFLEMAVGRPDPGIIPTSWQIIGWEELRRQLEDESQRRHSRTAR